MKRPMLFALFFALVAMLSTADLMAAPADCQQSELFSATEGEPQMSPANEVEIGGWLQPEPKFDFCRHDCLRAVRACNQACGGDPDCESNCSDQNAACLCGCGYCP